MAWRLQRCLNIRPRCRSLNDNRVTPTPESCCRLLLKLWSTYDYQSREKSQPYHGKRQGIMCLQFLRTPQKPRSSD